MFSVALEITATPVMASMRDQTEGVKGHTVKRLFGVITLLNLRMMRREKENERALKC